MSSKYAIFPGCHYNDVICICYIFIFVAIATSRESFFLWKFVYLLARKAKGKCEDRIDKRKREALECLNDPLCAAVERRTKLVSLSLHLE